MARLHNSYIRKRDTPLRELHDQQNRAIEELFHQTNTMTDAQISPLLTAFQLSPDGGVDAKRQRFRDFIGLSDV